MTARRGGATGRVRWWPGGAPAWSQRQLSRLERGPGAERTTTMWAPPAGARAGADTAIWAHRRCLWSVLVAALRLLSAGVSALEVITPQEIYVPYGTQGVLSCKFKSNIITSSETTVSWSFRPGEIHTTVSFFYFVDGQVFYGNFPLFKNRITWAGDLHKKDASIKIQNMQYNHNGTYICDVKNPPDIVSEPGLILLYVVNEKPTPSPPPQARPPPSRPQPPGIPRPRPPQPGPKPRTPRPWPLQQFGTPLWLVLGIVSAVILGLIFLVLFIILVLGKKPW